MIAYDLCCSKDHRFEGWFDDRQAFEKQKKNGLITCPVCADASVDIVPSTFGIRTASVATKPTDTPPSQALNPSQQFISFLEQNFEDVGTNFAREALKMHYEVSERRNIRGVSTKTEEDVLEKEGVKFFKFPVPRLDS